MFKEHKITYKVIAYSLYALIALSPFHFFFKAFVNSIFVDLWREILIILMSAFVGYQVIKNKEKVFHLSGSIEKILIAIVILGIFEIFNSFMLKTGLGGFRFMFGLLPVYFIVYFYLKKIGNSSKLLDVFIITGLIVALITIVQYNLIVVFRIIPVGSFLDFSRIYSPYGHSSPPGIHFNRALSLSGNPHEIGSFMMLCTIFVYSRFSVSKSPIKNKKKDMINLFIFTLSIMYSMSRSSLIGLAFAVLLITAVTKKFKEFMSYMIICLVIAFILPFNPVNLIKPVYTGEDAFFKLTLKEYFGIDKGINKEPEWEDNYEYPELKYWSLFGNGFSVTPSTAKKLNTAMGPVSIGGTDIHYIKVLLQLGLLGLLMFLILWIKAALISRKLYEYSSENRWIFAAIYSSIVASLIAAIHISPWEYPSISSFYYVLLAIIGVESCRLNHKRGSHV